jgi:hypothetical protein
MKSSFTICENDILTGRLPQCPQAAASRRA